MTRCRSAETSKHTHGSWEQHTHAHTHDFWEQHTHTRFLGTLAMKTLSWPLQGLPAAQVYCVEALVQGRGGDSSGLPVSSSQALLSRSSGKNQDQAHLDLCVGLLWVLVLQHLLRCSALLFPVKLLRDICTFDQPPTLSMF